MGIRNKNSTDYVHPDEPNLLDLHKAMTYDDAGVPHLRVFLGTDTITIQGDVNLVDKVKLWDGTNNLTFEQPTNDNESGQWSIPTENYNMVFNGSTWDRMRGNINDGVLTKVTNFPTSFGTTFTNTTIGVTQSTTPWKISANTTDNASNNPIYVNIGTTGTVELGSTTLAALETINVNATQTGTWTVGLSQSSLDALEHISIDNFPATQTVNGTVALDSATLSALEHISIDNFPATQAVSLTSLPDGNVTLKAGSNVIGKVQQDGDWTVKQGTSPWVVSGNVTVTPADNSVNIVKYLDNGGNSQLDATARLRVTPGAQQWWYNPTVDKDGDLRFIESFSGTGATSFFRQNTAMVRITSGTDSNGSTIRISRRRHKFRPGVGMLWSSTFNWDGVQTNVTKRRGQFTAFNGVFFELTTDLYFVARLRLPDGTLVETRIARTSFNYDKLDGIGTSGINLDPTATRRTGTITGFTSKTSHVISPTETNYTVVFTTSGTVPFVPGDKAHMSGLTPSGYNGSCNIIAVSAGSVSVNYASDPGTFTSGTGTLSNSNLDKLYTWWIDFNGDRTNIVRCGIMTPEGFHICHIEDFTGRTGTHFANAPAIPDRIEIFNTGSVSTAPTISCGAVSINTEAEVELNPGFGIAQSSSGVAFNKNTDVGNEFAIVGMALRAGEPYQRGDLQLQRIAFTDIGNLNPQQSAIFQWRLVMNPTFGGTAVPSEVEIGKSTRMWSYNTGTTITGGIPLIGGYTQGSVLNDISAALNFLNLGSNIDYTDSDKVVVVLKLLTGGSNNSSMYATINFNENL